MKHNNFISNEKLKYNNIIYFNENIIDIKETNKICHDLEKKVPGAFIYCSNLDSLILVKEEILKENEKDNRIIFNLIIEGNIFEKILFFLKKDIKFFENCIKNFYIHSMNKDKYLNLKEKYDNLQYDIDYNLQNVIMFIERTSSNEIKPFPIMKLVTYEEYTEKYADVHYQISKYYDDLTPESYSKYIEKLKSIISDKQKEKIINSFLVFEIKKDKNKDNDSSDKLIIKEYTKNNCHNILNKNLLDTNNLNQAFDESIAYFTARLMYSLNSYAIKNDMFCKQNNKILYRAIKLSYCSLLQYERAKNTIIVFLGFTSTTESESVCRKYAQPSKIFFSVIFIINNNIRNNWISNAINIQYLSYYEIEKEFLFQPFSFFYVSDVKIDINNKKAEIYLETIGKTEILEKKIKNGKKIQFNENEKIIEIKSF